jgi:hypothetical protein
MAVAREALLLLGGALVLSGAAFAAQELDDTCKESDLGYIDGRADVEILSVSYAEDSITVCAKLCGASLGCVPGMKYRAHLDYDVANGMASELDGRDDDSCAISTIGNPTGTTSDDTISFVCGRDGVNPRRVTGPAEFCTPVDAEGEFCCLVSVLDLVRQDGTIVEECNPIDIWIDTQKKGIQDRAPDTDGEDGCSKPTGPEEVLLGVFDYTPPELADVPADLTVDCPDDVEPPPEVTATDNCDPDPVVTFAQEPEVPQACADIIRTWTATDASGNATAETQAIAVEDDTRPVLSGVPGDRTVQCPGDVPAPPAVTATDDCDQSVDVAFSETPAGDPLCGPTLTRSWTATDGCGNQATASQVISVEPDSEMPNLVGVPGDARVECWHAVPAAPEVTATSRCGVEIDVQADEWADGEGECEGAVHREWMALSLCPDEDVGGYPTAFAYQEVTVKDDEFPTVRYPGSPASGNWWSTTVPCGTPCPEAPEPVVDDNCGLLLSGSYPRLEEPSQRCPGDIDESEYTSAVDLCGQESQAVWACVHVD